MVSDFIEEHGGFLQLTDGEVEDAKRIYSNPNFPQYGREILHIGAENEGYWSSELFIKHVKKVAKIHNTLNLSTGYLYDAILIKVVIIGHRVMMH